MSGPVLQRPDEFPDDPVGLQQNRELARARAYSDLGEGRPTTAGFSVFVLIVLPWLFTLTSVYVLASWFSTATDAIRTALLNSPIDQWIATYTDDPAGRPGSVTGLLGAAVLLVAVVWTALRGWYWRHWFKHGGSAATLRLVVWTTTIVRSVTLVVGLAFAGVAGGIARGVDLDPNYRPTAASGWWPIAIVVGSCVWVSIGSVRRVLNKVRARIASLA